jgi:hypothetical protein
VLAAAGRTAGTATLNVAPDLYGSSLLYAGIEERSVPMVTVDELIAERALPAPYFLKLDVQGYELEVLAGAHRTMDAAELVLMELRLYRAPPMPMLHEAIAWMTERGFRPYEIADVQRRPLDDAMAQVDVLFAREGISLLAFEGWA